MGRGVALSLGLVFAGALASSGLAPAVLSPRSYWPVCFEGGGSPSIGDMPMFGVAGSAVGLRAGVGAHPPTTVERIVGAEGEPEWLQGCFMLHSVLSSLECEQIISVAETIGFKDVDAGKNTQGALTWLLDEEALLGPLFHRCQPFLPAIGPAAGGDLAGLNARCRFYRYQPNSKDTFRPHLDDSSPGSGFVPGSNKRELRFDAFAGDRTSQLSFLLYLNDDFAGGETTFFPPPESGAVTNVCVCPRQGAVLCFPQTLHLDTGAHGKGGGCSDGISAPLHEGSPVRRGRAAGAQDPKPKVAGKVAVSHQAAARSRPKYVMRSDVLYFVR
uniref:Fe2OG dioxygenase domain-containing protein n=1 Tax=Rhizochromulina marina TaxID=1034831 RepID=A0A7S2W6I3_9STRA|mmetsp:Transcript_16303/g.47809  ORF Transcript_16303/g.47809 Transcript_16303/m.47809 type:complete len:329 (+) Transcript_16303:183-1169(+)